MENITNERDRGIAERASHNLDPHEPTDLELAIIDRHQMGLPGIGPLTREDQEGVGAYERYQEEAAAEYEAEQAAGGRTICPRCNNRSVKHSTVCTLGYPGHPGADYSNYGVCETEGCGYTEL